MTDSIRPSLFRPKEFRARHPGLIPSQGALQHLLNERGRNGLLKCGAIIESPIGLVIDEKQFLAWLFGEGAKNGRLRSVQRRARAERPDRASVV